MSRGILGKLLAIALIEALVESEFESDNFDEKKTGDVVQLTRDPRNFGHIIGENDKPVVKLDHEKQRVENREECEKLFDQTFVVMMVGLEKKYKCPSVICDSEHNADAMIISRDTGNAYHVPSQIIKLVEK